MLKYRINLLKQNSCSFWKAPQNQVDVTCKSWKMEFQISLVQILPPWVVGDGKQEQKFVLGFFLNDAKNKIK